MASTAPIYDLITLLDLSATDDARAKVVADTRAAIEAQGTLVGHHPWGQRQLAYEIAHRDVAEYHLFQFHASPALLSTLGRQLRITDAVLRHRIIKLAPGTPPPPEMGAHAPRPVAEPRSDEAPAGQAERAPA